MSGGMAWGRDHGDAGGYDLPSADELGMVFEGLPHLNETGGKGLLERSGLQRAPKFLLGGHAKMVGPCEG
jgi:hypothetical protein